MIYMASKQKKIPKHRSEDRERDFWSNADSTDHIDWDNAQPLVLPNLKPTLKTISLRLPEHLLADPNATVGSFEGDIFGIKRIHRDHDPF
jgi:hypothetical protein